MQEGDYCQNVLSMCRMFEPDTQSFQVMVRPHPLNWRPALGELSVPQLFFVFFT